VTSRHLIQQFVISFAVLVLANFLVDRLAINSVPRQLIRTAGSLEAPTDLFLGNSTMAAGLDQATFAEGCSGCRPINLGLGSSSPVEHYLIYRQVRKHSNANVFYGFIDTQLTDNPIGNYESLFGNRAMAYYVESDVAREYYTSKSLLNDLIFRLCSQIPMIVERSAIWAKIERFRRWVGEFGMPARSNNRFGRAEDFILIELGVEDFVSRCKHAVKEQSPICSALTAMFDQVLESGSRLFVVEMPMSSSHRKRYYQLPIWNAYRENIKKQVESLGGLYIEASEWVADDGFADGLHLNAKGAKQFSRRISHFSQSQ